jgi:type I restriction enzyme S subunit
LIVRVGELGQRRIVFERCGRVILPESEIAKFKLERGDIVIARAIGSEGQLGKASLFDGHHEQVAIDSHVMRLRLNPSICDSTWFYTLLALPEGKKLLQQAGGATAVQFNINAKQASSLSVPLPPLAEQRHFASRINSLAQKSSHLKAHMRKLHGLFSSLQHRAFRGEL